MSEASLASRAGTPTVDRPPIHFYYPLGDPKGVVAEQVVNVFSREKHRPGNYNWTVKTWAHLTCAGYTCKLTDTLPEEGIVVTHRELLPNRAVPGARQLFVCVVADFYRHPFAQLHTLQNRSAPMLTQPSPAWPGTFLPLWPQTGLRPRDPARGERFENIAYYGLPERLAPQLRSKDFERRMQSLGFRFRVVERNCWDDYRETDAVLAVRSFAQLPFDKFPPSKLYNSWFAGVPALLGRESAYRAERRSELDYFEVRGVEDVIDTLLRLRDDPAQRLAIQRNAALRAAENRPERLIERWIAFLDTTATPAYWRWRAATSAQRALFLASRTAHYGAYACGDFGLRAARFARRKSRELLP